VKKQIITIAGRPGSGKSTTAKAAASQLGFRHFSSGDLFRLLAKERGIDVLQANLTAEENTEIDNLVDGRLQEMGAQDDKLVVDSRMAWHWMPFSFKVFLDLDLTIAAERIISGMDSTRLINESIPNDPIEYASILQQRLASETRRYRALYDVDPYDTTNYDLVIDTATNNVEQVLELLITKFKVWQNS
jgi:cytidylate kinase